MRCSESLFCWSSSVFRPFDKPFSNHRVLGKITAVGDCWKYGVSARYIMSHHGLWQRALQTWSSRRTLTLISVSNCRLPPLLDTAENELWKRSPLTSRSPKFGIHLFEQVNILGGKSTPKFKRSCILRTNSTYETWNKHLIVTRIPSKRGHLKDQVTGNRKLGLRSANVHLWKLHPSCSYVRIMYGSFSKKRLWVVLLNLCGFDDYIGHTR